MSSATPSFNIALSTHVLNTSNGLPAGDLLVHLEAQDDPAPGAELGSGAWRRLVSRRTNADGRVGGDDFPALTSSAPLARYRLVFEAAAYWSAQGVAVSKSFFPQITIAWQCSAEEDANRKKLHVPLLLASYGYSTYRGS
jgi:hydroxyisourate hydrolase